MIRLNLGCGRDIRVGYLNVDMNPVQGATQADLSIFPWVWDDNSIDEILMLDFLEHFPYRQTLSILNEVWRILKPGAFVDIQVPDFSECSAALNFDCGMLCNSCGAEWDEAQFMGKYYKCKACGRDIYDVAESAMQRLYGGQDYEGNWHYTAFTKNTLTKKLLETGFVDPEFLEEEHQRKNWNFKVRVFKSENAWGDDG